MMIWLRSHRPKRPRRTQRLGVGSPPPPVLPGPDAMGGLSCRVYMAEVIPYVNVALPKFLSGQGVLESDEPMPSRPPLHIKSGESTDLRSFKESWSPENCYTSLRSAGLYEAGGNLTWVDGETTHQTLPSEDSPLKWLPQFDESGVFVFKGRVKFPVVMECHMPDAPKADAYPGNMLPLGGHAYVYAWYYAAWKALRESSVERCKQLYECALCTTLCVRLSGCVGELAELS